MQQVKIAEIRTKSGEGKKGPWTLVIIKGEDGAEFTSFDKALEKLGKGAVIEIDPEVTSVDGKTKVNIKDGWKLISEGAPPIPAGEQAAGIGGGGRGYKDAEIVKFEESGRRYRQNVDRISIERQSVYNGAISLIPQYANIKLPPGTDNELNGLILEALKWGRQALKATVQVVPPAEPKAEEKATGTAASAQKPATTGTGTALPDFKTGVELVNYATKQGMKLDKIKEILAINNPTEIKDVKAATAILFSGQAKAKTPADTKDPDGLFREK